MSVYLFPTKSKSLIKHDRFDKLLLCCNDHCAYSKMFTPWLFGQLVPPYTNVQLSCAGVCICALKC